MEAVLSLKAIERRLMHENPLPREILRMFMHAVSEYQPLRGSTAWLLRKRQQVAGYVMRMCAKKKRT